MPHLFALPWYLYLRNSLGGVLIVAGVAALITPFTPGAWLIPLGVAVIVGKERAFCWSRRTLGQRWHDKLRVERILHFFVREKK